MDTLLLKIPDTLSIHEIGNHADTILARIPDTLSFHEVGNLGWFESRSDFLAVISLAVSVLAVFISVFWPWYAGWKKEIATQWIDLTERRIDLWLTLDFLYGTWKGDKQGNDTLGKLLKQARINVKLYENPGADGVDDLARYLKTGEGMGTYEAILYSFCTSVWFEKDWPTDRHECPLSKDEFGKCCAKLTWSLDGWARMVPRLYLRKRFQSDGALLTILTYLEMSLKEKIKERWSDRSELFKLAYRVRENRRRSGK